MSNLVLDLYQAAKKADDAYEAAIIIHYGRKATRWDHPARDYPPIVRQAYDAKVKADAAHLAARSAAMRLT